MSYYELTYPWGDVDYIKADLAQASAPVFVNGNTTPFQTADARHNVAELMDLVIDWACEDADNGTLSWRQICEDEYEEGLADLIDGDCVLDFGDCRCGAHLGFGSPNDVAPQYCSEACKEADTK
jgi:hypothetical protein